MFDHVDGVHAVNPSNARACTCVHFVCTEEHPEKIANRACTEEYQEILFPTIVILAHEAIHHLRENRNEELNGIIVHEETCDKSDVFTFIYYRCRVSTAEWENCTFTDCETFRLSNLLLDVVTRANHFFLQLSNFLLLENHEEEPNKLHANQYACPRKE